MAYVYEALGDTDWSKCARTAPNIEGTMTECIDDAGNVIATKPITAGAASSGQTVLGLSQNQLMIAGVGVAALILFTRKKRR